MDDYQSVFTRSYSVCTDFNPFSRDLILFAPIINPFPRDLITFARNINPFSRYLIPFARIMKRDRNHFIISMFDQKELYKP